MKPKFGEDLLVLGMGCLLGIAILAWLMSGKPTSEAPRTSMTPAVWVTNTFAPVCVYADGGLQACTK